MITFILNNELIETNQAAGSTVLDFVRYQQHLSGTKIGCREGDCGACTVLVGNLDGDQVHYQSMTSCLMPLRNAQGKHIVTVEGINQEKLTPVQSAIVEEGGTQCGFCTVGFVLSFTGFALSEKAKNYDNAIAAIDGNICRCTGYKSLERAAEKITNLLAEKEGDSLMSYLVEEQFVPDYFMEIPKRLQAVVSKGNGDISSNNEIYVGGGTDLFVQRPEEMEEEENANFIFDDGALKYIEEKGNRIHIGASSTAEDINSSKIMNVYFPNLWSHIKLVSSTPIRNMGTIAGNLANASPIGDLTIFFLGLDSTISLRKDGKIRSLPLREFYLDYKKMDKKEGEMLVEISFDVPAASSYFNFEKVCKRTHLDIATVNTACQFQYEDNRIIVAHLSAGGVGPIPKYLAKASAAMQGMEINEENLQKINTIIQEEISPISDVRGSADYKRLLLRQLFFAHFLKRDSAILLKNLV